MRILLLLLLVTACRKCPDRVPPFTRYPIQGREEVLPSGKVLRRPLYSAKMPASWKALPSARSLKDTTKPNATFEITPTLHLTVHSFPTNELAERIPPSFQVERWKNQDSQKAYIESVHQGGFTGLKFETPSTLAWSFQLDPELYQTLAILGRSHEENAYYKQMRSDFTIKVSGDSEELALHREEITFFAQSLELFQAIPANL